MNRLAAVIISVVFIFTACGRHAVEREVFSTAETGNEIFETKETEQEEDWLSFICRFWDDWGRIGVVCLSIGTIILCYFGQSFVRQVSETNWKLIERFNSIEGMLPEVEGKENGGTIEERITELKRVKEQL
jgi:hypothetical protein